jgi:hypothetical protein
LQDILGPGRKRARRRPEEKANILFDEVASSSGIGVFEFVTQRFDFGWSQHVPPVSPLGYR